MDEVLLCYSIFVIAFFSMATTSFGSFAKANASTIFWPSASIQCRNSVIAFFFIGSAILVGTSNQVKLEMGYAVFPAAFVTETRKSAGISFADPAAAAVT